MSYKFIWWPIKIAPFSECVCAQLRSMSQINHNPQLLAEESAQGRWWWLTLYAYAGSAIGFRYFGMEMVSGAPLVSTFFALKWVRRQERRSHKTEPSTWRQEPTTSLLLLNASRRRSYLYIISLDDSLSLSLHLVRGQNIVHSWNLFQCIRPCTCCWRSSILFRFWIQVLVFLPASFYCEYA